MASGARHGHLHAYLRTLAVAIVVAVLAELLVFNFASLESRSFTAVEPESVATDSPVGKDGSALLSKGRAWVTLDFGDGADLRNVHLSARSDEPLRFKVSACDEGNALFYTLAAVDVSDEAYVRVNPSGRVYKLRVELKGEHEAAVPVKVDCNVPQPLDVIPLRLLLVVLLGVTIWTLRPNSPVYHQSIRDRRFLAAVCVVLVAAVLGALAASYNPAFYDGDSQYHQYHDLAVALSQGHVYLDDSPSKALMGLDNPYDPSAREAGGVAYNWDEAYYDGHYYVYFGLLPVLLFHLPFYLLTGAEFYSAFGVGACLVAYVLGVVFLLYAICMRWFRRASQGVFVICVAAVVLGSWVVYCCHDPYLYPLPISMALALLAWGLGLWVRATRDPHRLHLPTGMVGSLLMASIVFCRPQLVVGCAFGIVLIAPYVRHHLRRDWWRIVLVLCPFVVVFALAGVYNAMRFSGPLDFGASYNLTTNDMTHRGFRLARIPSALFVYLFQPPQLALDAPFIREVSRGFAYYGRVISEPMYGGLFMLVPITLMAFLPLLRRVRRHLDATLGWTCAVAACAGVVLVVFDANAAGILPRYTCDFGFFFSLVAALSILAWCTGQAQVYHGVQPEFIAPVPSRRGGMRYGFGFFGMALTVLLVASLVVQIVWTLQ